MSLSRRRYCVPGLLVDRVFGAAVVLVLSTTTAVFLCEFFISSISCYLVNTLI